WQTGCQLRPSPRCGYVKYLGHENAPGIPSVHADADARFRRGRLSKISECGCQRGLKVVARCRIDRVRSAMLPLFAETTYQCASSVPLQKSLRLNREIGRAHV